MAAPGAAAPERPRLLVLTSTFPRWRGDNLPVFVFDLCRQLAADFEVHVVAPHAAGTNLQDAWDGLHVHRYRYLPETWETLAYGAGMPATLGAHWRAWIQALFLGAAQCLAALRLAWRIRPRVIHAHWILPQGLVAGLVAPFAPGRPPFVCTIHGSDLYLMNGWPLRRIKQWVLGRAAHLTVVSRAMLDAVAELGVPPGRISVVPMGVDVDTLFHAATERERDPDLMVFVGRLVAMKGAGLLIAALAILAPHRPALRLVILGDGPERDALGLQARQLAIHERVHFLGAVTHAEVAGYLRRGALAVFPFMPGPGRQPEGMGLVVVEAQACACPVVAFSAPAVCENIRDGENGLLVSPGDVPGLAAAADRLLGDRALAARLGAAGAASAREKFGWGRVGARYRELLHNRILNSASI